MDIRSIRDKVIAGHYNISFSHTEKLRLRKISTDELEAAISTGIIIERYEDDPRGESCLILGYSKGYRPLHIVCGELEEDELLIITAYEPDTTEWSVDFKTRKGGC